MGSNKPRRRTVDDELTHPLLGDLPTLQLLTPRDEVGALPFLPSAEPSVPNLRF